jgi:hypothetical protein
MPASPSRFTEGQMEKVGVEVRDASKILLACKECGQTWSPNLLKGGRLPRGYWHCPQGCNT